MNHVEALMEPAADAPRSGAAGLSSWLEVDRGAFEGNLRALAAVLGGQTEACLVLKADAYGHGLDLLMPSVLRASPAAVAVTDNAEARTVRACGFRGRLLRLRVAGPDEVAEGFPYDLEELLGSLDNARDLSALATRQGRTLRYHLALNSGGMSREGLDLAAGAGEEALAILRLPRLEVAGIMTHFPVRAQDDMGRGFRRFRDDSAWVLERGRLDRRRITLHCANSYATLNVPEARMDMVRCGGILYRPLDPASAARHGFRSIAQFKSRVGSINAYPAGNTVSYDRTFTLPRPSRLASVPVGYSDGFRCRADDQRAVLVRGRRLAVVGKGTMNTIMVDVTDHPDIRPGDEVVLFGRQGGEAITLDAFARSLGCPTWEEMATSVGNQNPRVRVD
jgi:alanine racemase